MFYGTRARAPHEPSLDVVLDEVRDRLEAWRNRDLRKQQLKKERRARNAARASGNDQEVREVSSTPGTTVLDAQRFYQHCCGLRKKKAKVQRQKAAKRCKKAKR
jgi:hypothetical protein